MKRLFNEAQKSRDKRAKVDAGLLFEDPGTRNIQRLYFGLCVLQ